MSKIKTEHAGAKNGGGFHGPRVMAKAMSRGLRREADKVAVAEESAIYCKECGVETFYFREVCENCFMERVVE